MGRLRTFLSLAHSNANAFRHNGQRRTVTFGKPGARRVVGHAPVLHKYCMQPCTVVVSDVHVHEPSVCVRVFNVYRTRRGELLCTPCSSPCALLIGAKYTHFGGRKSKNAYCMANVTQPTRCAPLRGQVRCSHKSFATGLKTTPQRRFQSGVNFVPETRRNDFERLRFQERTCYTHTLS